MAPQRIGFLHPGDMGISFGYPDAHDPPYPPELEAARQTIKEACDAAGIR